MLREARGLVEFLFAKSLPAAEVLDRIRRDPTLSAPVRRRALELTELYGGSLLTLEAEARSHGGDFDGALESLRAVDVESVGQAARTSSNAGSSVKCAPLSGADP